MSITYLEAIREAQAKALADDPRVFIYGQDVGVFGGAFKATKNLARGISRTRARRSDQRGRHGRARPSARPLKVFVPIVEMQFADFSTPGFNQIINHAATLYWRTQCSLSDHHSFAFGRNFRERPFSQPEHGGDLRALSGIDRHDAGDGGGRLQHVAGSGGHRRPGHFLRAQISCITISRPTACRPRRCRWARRALPGPGAT